jgi:Ca-activated chloride channel homolog
LQAADLKPLLTRRNKQRFFREALAAKLDDERSEGRRSRLAKPIMTYLRKRWLCECVLAFVCTSVFSAAIALSQVHDSQGFVISKDVDLVLLPVTVMNARGQFVSGLDASNFQVYENGQRQRVSLFRTEDIPVTVGLVVDHSGSMVAWRDQVIEGARAFVQTSNVQDREFVVNFGSDVRLVLPPDMPFTDSVDQLEVALSLPYASGRTALYDALAIALQHIREDKLNKKVLLLISDGGDNASLRTFEQVLRMAQSANVLIYSIGLLDELSGDQNPTVLKKFAANTGGESYFPSSVSEVVGDCRMIAADIRHQYTLGYNPTDDIDGGYRKIRVHVTAPGSSKLFIRTRAGYFLPSATAAHMPKKRRDR